MKKLKIAILIILSIIIIIITTIICMKGLEKKEKQQAVTPGIEEERPFDVNEKIARNEYYILSKIANTYIQSLNKNNSAYIKIDEDGNQVIEEKSLKNGIINLLSKEYVQKNNININNLYNYVNTFEEQLLFVPINMKGISTGNVKTYVVQGIALNFEYELEKEFNIVINVDYSNRTFSVEPTSKEYEEINTNGQIKNIEKNDHNQYKTTGLNIENIVKDYMNNLKRMMLAKPELAYEHLDQEYRDKRFGDVDNFKEYIKKNEEEIKKIYVDKYLANSFENYSQYVGKDKYDNTYIFNEKEIFNYTVLLDTYTINSEEFKKVYNESKNEYRVKLNVDKWIKMLNNRDYENAYKCLDKKFREEKFGAEEEFEKYMRDNFPLHYKLSVGATEEVNGVYKQKIMLKDITGESKEQKENTIIMQLKDDYEFVMSFEV